MSSALLGGGAIGADRRTLKLREGRRPNCGAAHRDPVRGRRARDRGDRRGDDSSNASPVRNLAPGRVDVPESAGTLVISAHAGWERIP
ncbi:MAG: hypothetical protein JWN04_1457 [Myxococcaceae bacterium]|nr:hypothetical protein [Myxococcaceae bacterium]